MPINIFTPHCIFCLNPRCMNTSKSSGSILLTIPHSVQMPGPAGKQRRIFSHFCFLNKPSSWILLLMQHVPISQRSTPRKHIFCFQQSKENTTSLVAPHPQLLQPGTEAALWAQQFQHPSIGYIGYSPHKPRRKARLPEGHHWQGWGIHQLQGVTFL